MNHRRIGLMGPDPKILDDIARVAGGAVNIVSGIQQQIRDDMKTRMDDMADKMDLVPRRDLDDALAMIRSLTARVEELEKRVGESGAAKKKKAPGKKTTKKTSKK